MRHKKPIHLHGATDDVAPNRQQIETGRYSVCLQNRLIVSIFALCSQPE